MSAIDKFKNKAEEVLGEAKEKLGEVTGDDKLRAEGKKDQAESDVKGATESVKDKFSS